MFSIVSIVAEMVGGGITPYHRVDVIKLLHLPGEFMTGVVQFAQVMFVVSLFYYAGSLISVLKNQVN